MPRGNKGKKRTKSRQILNQYYKTKMCPHIETGCIDGESCSYAHSKEELRVTCSLKKTRMCGDWEKGVCPLDSEDCKFAHGLDDLRSTPDFYKVNLCTQWMQTKECVNGDLCRYAHGEDDLRERVYPNQVSNKEDEIDIPNKVEQPEMKKEEVLDTCNYIYTSPKKIGFILPYQLSSTSVGSTEISSYSPTNYSSMGTREAFECESLAKWDDYASLSSKSVASTPTARKKMKVLNQPLKR